MGRVTGKVAFITGAARGQGRSHAIRLAQEGADIIAVDVLEQVPFAPYGPATEEDLAETVRLVEALDRRIVARKADVRDSASLEAALGEGIAELGRLDIVAVNAGITTETVLAEQLSEDVWTDTLDVNLSGAWRTCKAAIPYLKAANSGSIILTSSGLGLAGTPHMAHYVASKHGVVGLMRTLALELAPHSIRVNAVHPTLVDTPMIHTESMYRLFRPELEHPTVEDFAVVATAINALPVPWVEAIDISNAVLWLASDEARYVTGVTLSVDAGFGVK